MIILHLEVVEGCDVVIDALDSVNARYALNKACVNFEIPFVTGAAVGTSGQAFTVLPKQICMLLLHVSRTR